MKDSIEQKAKELVDKLYEVIDDNRFSSQDWGKATARQCAIICVEEIIASHGNKSPNYENETYWHPIDYWQQVKERLLAKQ